MLRMPENRLLRRVRGPERKEGKRGLAELHNKICTLHSSSNCIKTVNSKRVTWAVNVQRMEFMINTHRVIIDGVWTGNWIY
jgi:hypothetical protein